MDGEYPAPEEGDGDLGADHGTTILSKLAGITLGVVKNPLVVVVRASPAGDCGIIAWLQQIDWILENWGHVREDGRLPVGIICMAGACLVLDEDDPATEDEEKAISDIADRLKKTVSEGLVLINSSGNNGGISCAQILCAHVRHCNC